MTFECFDVIIKREGDMVMKLKKMIVKQPRATEEEQLVLTLTRRFEAVSNALKSADGWKLYTEKDNLHWINPKAKARSRAINYYAYDNRDYSELNNLLNRISKREARMREEEYNLEGVKSFNRNAWMDLSRESNAIEGIFEDFDYDLLDFRTKLRGQFAADPKIQDFDKYEYYKMLLGQICQITENNDCVVVTGKKSQHKLKIETIRHFIAFKYIYKCAKKDRKGNRQITASEFIDVIQNVASLLSGTDLVPFRSDRARVDGAPWTPVDGKDVVTRLEALAEWFADEKQSGSLHPIEKAAIFHAEYVRIHPFGDGNGRTGRILTNYILIRNEMPTISVRQQNTQEYFDAINKAVKDHEIDDLMEIFYKAVYNSALKIDECLDYIEAHQTPTKNVDGETVENTQLKPKIAEKTKTC